MDSYSAYLEKLSLLFKEHFKLNVHEPSNTFLKHVIDWNNVQTTSKARAVHDYIAMHPDSPYIELCLRMLQDEEEKELWLNATTEHKLDSYIAFLKRVENSKFKGVAELLIEKLSPKTDICIPDIGDFGDVEVIELMVKVGQEVNKDDLLIVLESDKVTMEIPSPYRGIIESIECTLGEKVSEGSLIAKISEIN